MGFLATCHNRSIIAWHESNILFRSVLEHVFELFRRLTAIIPSPGKIPVFMFPTALLLVSEALNFGMSLKTPAWLASSFKLVFMAIFALKFLIPVYRIRDYYRHCEISGKTRERYFFLTDVLKTSTVKNPLVLLDEDTGETSDFHHFFVRIGMLAMSSSLKRRKQGANLKEFVAR